jgi:YVTN family beta-propeller protein
MLVKYQKIYFLILLYILLSVFTIIITNYAFAQIPGSYRGTLYDIANLANSNQVAQISVGKNPINMEKLGTNLYVVNSEDNTVSVIDGDNYKNVTNIPVGRGPLDIASSKSKLYVANRDNNTVSVIDEKNYKNVTNIPVGKYPVAIAPDAFTHKVYVANSGGETVSIIGEDWIKVLAGVSFDVQPPNSGNIICKNLPFQMPTNLYGYVFSGDKCIAKPNKGYEFQSWVVNLHGNHTQTIKVSNLAPTNIYDYIASFLDLTENFFGIKNNINFIVNSLGIKPYLNNISKSLNLTSPEDESTVPINQFGNYTANFKSLPPPVPPEYIATLFSFMLSTFVGTLLIPAVIGWRNSRSKGKRLDYHYKKIKSLYVDGKLDIDDIAELDILRNNITDHYTKGRINKEQFDKLVNEAEISYMQIFKNEINSLVSSSENNKEKKLNEIENVIKDTYNKEKISNEQFTNLKKEISIQYGEI